MSEADAEDASAGREIWIEKYRPQTLEEIHGQQETIERLQSYIEGGELPHLLFSGPAGVGKTTSATAIAREIYGDDWRGNFLELNASDERGIDVVRDRIKNFARSAFGGQDYRIIFLDEADSLCVPPGTEVVTGYPSSPEVKKIEEVSSEGEPIPSVDFETNEIQSDKGKLVDSGVADFFDVELSEGRTITASLGHPFFTVNDEGGLVETELRELRPGDEIADFRDDIGVSPCEACGDWTAGRFCSVPCKNEGHSEELGHLVRSDWEYEVANTLQDAGVEYEPSFELSDSVFHPDFLVGDTVVEVKGVAALRGQTEKVEEFLQTYGDEELPHDEHYGRDEFSPAVVSDGGRQDVETVEVESITHSHRGKAYNITMEGTPNFMLANGLLTHNTSDAQSALRRTMEQFSDNTRFILSCNYSSKIIDPIQSRCAVFRFSPLSDEAITAQLTEIAEAEEIDVTEEGLDALVYAANGDMRRGINSLQAAATTGDVVDAEAVYAVTATARPEDIEEMVAAAVAGDFPKARATLDTLLTDVGMAGGDVIDQLHRSAWEFDLSERAVVRLLERLGEADYRIAEGASEQVQLEALLAALALDDEA